jgi:FkbM family methyltransferase
MGYSDRQDYSPVNKKIAGLQTVEYYVKDGVTFVRSLIGRAKSHIRRQRLRGPRITRAFREVYPDAKFVQIGSNDGSKHDPLNAAINESRWTGILVEPVPYVFSRLQATYRSNPRVRLENIAIADRQGTLPFYHLAEDPGNAELPTWYDELGSFRRDVVLKHRYRIPDIDSRLRCVDIPTMSLAQLLLRHGMETVDLIHTDTEGYDFEILRTVDWSDIRPLLLIYEHKHFSAETRLECQNMLRRNGYVFIEEGADTWCLDAKIRDNRHAKFLHCCRRLFPELS